MNQRIMFVASVKGENESYFALTDASDFSCDSLDSIAKKFKESASKYFRVDKQYCDVLMSVATSVVVAAALEANNRADGYFKDMDKKCFEFLMDAVKRTQSEEVNKQLKDLLGSLADFI